MRYTEKDIPKIRITQFLEALGEKLVKEFDDFKFYYAPYRDDTEPMLVVNDCMNSWYDHATDEIGTLRDLAKLTARGDHQKDIDGYIIKFMNEYERAKEMLATSHRQTEPIVSDIDFGKVRLTDFMKALGQERPVATDGNLRIYNAPYDPKGEPTMVVNTETNLWRDTKSGAYGGIFDLAHELTGSCNMAELKQYIAGEIAPVIASQNLSEQNMREQTTDYPESKKTQHKMRL